MCCCKEYIFRTIKSFLANQNDVIKNFAVVMSVVIKRVQTDRIYSVIRWVFTIPKLLQMCKYVLCNSATNGVFLLQNDPKDLDPSFKMDLVLSNCFGRVKTLSYDERNMV